MKRLLFMVALTICFVSCKSVKDLGSYSNPSEDEVVVLNIDSGLTIKKINTRRVNWGPGNTISMSNSEIRIPAGIYDLEASYYKVYGSAVVTADKVTGTFYFEPGETYNITLVGSLNKGYLSAENPKGENAEIPLVLSNIPKINVEEFERVIINTPSDSPKNHVVLDNQQFKIVLQNDQNFVMTDKSNNKNILGKYMLYTNYSKGTAKLYLQECDQSSYSKEDFILSDYRRYSQYILIPKYFDGTKVEFVYEKPFDILGNEIAFDLSYEE